MILFRNFSTFFYTVIEECVLNAWEVSLVTIYTEGAYFFILGENITSFTSPWFFKYSVFQ